MPNTGMLDHRAFVPSARRHSIVHWMSSWPDARAGYETAAHSRRVAKFSRHLSKTFQVERQVSITSRPSTARLNNSLSPFNTIMKPTCGYYFSIETDNRKRRIGIPPTDLVSWRPNTARVPRVKTAVH